VDEALQTAQQEREQRMALKKELEALKNAEHLSSLADMLNRMGEVRNSRLQISSAFLRILKSLREQRATTYSRNCKILAMKPK